LTKANLIFSFLFILWYSPISGQSFQCDGTQFISLYSGGAPTTFYDVNYDGFNVEFDFMFSIPFKFNATGYNTLDNFIYGVDNDSNDILQIRSDGSYTVVASEPQIIEWQTGAGTCSGDGIYVVHERNENKLYAYDIANGFNLIQTIPLRWSNQAPVLGNFDVDLDDLVFSIEDSNILYSYQRNYTSSAWGPEPTQTKGAFLAINMDFNSVELGTVDVISTIPVDQIRQIGALFYGSDGNLYGYGALSVDPLDQNRLIRIFENDGTVELIDVGPTANGTDGCSCPVTVRLTKEIVNFNIECDSTEILYAIAIYNSNSFTISGFDFIDSLTFDGEIIVHPSSSTLNGTIASNSTDQVLRISNCSLPPNSANNFQFRVRTPNTVGTLTNQCEIRNLGIFGIDQLISDDPNSNAFNDATSLTIDNSDIPSSTINTIDTILCDGDELLINSTYYNESGSFTEFIENGSANGCDSTINIQISIDESQEHFIDTILCPGNAYNINGTSYNEEGSYSHLLSGQAQNTCDSVINLNIAINNENLEYYLPNIINPNSKRNNDCFRIYFPSGIERSYTMEIYDRWGELVFKDIGDNICWNGRFNDKPLVPGVYVYLIYFGTTCNDENKIVGNITLLF